MSNDELIKALKGALPESVSPQPGEAVCLPIEVVQAALEVVTGAAEA